MPTADRETRLRSIAVLQAGWLDGDGQAIDPHCVRVARELLGSLPEDEPWAVFPSSEGGVSLEQQTGTQRLGILIEAEDEILVSGLAGDPESFAEYWCSSVDQALDALRRLREE